MRYAPGDGVENPTARTQVIYTPIQTIGSKGQIWQTFKPTVATYLHEMFASYAIPGIRKVAELAVP
jgi:hypothetical protein